MNLKCAFHVHSGKDPLDKINYTEKELIDHAANLNFDVLAITCHTKIIFSEDLKKYAKKKKILLVPALEARVQKKDVLIINADKSSEKIRTFDDLRVWKKKHKESLVIAPHPYMPSSHSLGAHFKTNLDCFDAVEYSFFYSRLINFNKPAERIAKENNLPIIATSDSHFLGYLDIGYTEINTKQKSFSEIKKSILKNKIKNSTKPLSFLHMLYIYVKMLLRV